MGFRIARYEEEGRPAWAVVTGDRLLPAGLGDVPLADVLTRHLDDLAALARSGETGKAGTSAVGDAKLLSPVTRPTRLLCQGLNYASHRSESGREETSDWNLFFRKDESSITGPFDDVRRPAGCRLLDYEIELGLVIRREITAPTDVTDERLLDVVAGMVIANDVSARDIMFRATFGQWYEGKSGRAMCPLGPFLYLLEPGEAGLVHDLRLELSVNGEVRQRASTRDLIFKPAETLTRASRFVDLAPGDVLLTGTPGGVAIEAPSRFVQGLGTMFFSDERRVELLVQRQGDNPRFLRDGDVIRTTIRSPDGSVDLGTQVNRVVGT